MHYPRLLMHLSFCIHNALVEAEAETEAEAEDGDNIDNIIYVT